MPDTTKHYNLIKPKDGEFYDIGDANGNMDKIDAALKQNAEAAEDLGRTKADLQDGKVPAEQLPKMDYDPAGTAKGAVTAHNTDQTAHQDIRKTAEDAASAVAGAVQAAQQALDLAEGIAYTIDATPSQGGTLTYSGQAQSPTWNSYNAEKLTLGGVTSATEAGEYVATFKPKDKYKWSDGTQDVKSVSWSIRRATVSLPTQAGTVTYTGSAQSPSWTGYDTGKLSLGGVTSGTNAGSYSAEFTPRSNYQWPDGGTGARSAAWSIGKAAGSLSLSPTSLALNIAAKAKTITVTRAGNGAVTASSSAPSVATVAVSGTTVTVTAQAAGSATITISVAAGSNHNAPGSKTAAVTVSLPTTTLNANSWETIQQTSDAGLGKNYWSVGDTKSVTLNGAVGAFTFSNLAVNAFILGFDHNAGKEGSHRIHFQLGKIGTTAVALCDNSYNNEKTSDNYFNMNNSRTNSGGWNGSKMRKTLLGNSNTPTNPLSGSLMAALPADLRAVMKSVTKYTDNTGGGTNNSGNITATTDYLFLLAEFEVFGSRSYANSYEQNSQAQYDYYKAGNSRVANKHSAVSTAVWWWLRSPTYNNSNTFCNVTSDGSLTNSTASWSAGVRPGFAA